MTLGEIGIALFLTLSIINIMAVLLLKMQINIHWEVIEKLVSCGAAEADLLKEIVKIFEDDAKKTK